MSKYTDEELEGLTEEERAAILEEDEDEILDPKEEVSETPKDEDEKPADEGDDDDSEKGKDNEDDGAAPSGEADKGDNVEGEDAGKPEDKPKAQAEGRKGPLLNAETVADADNMLAEIENRKEELATKFEDGDMDVREYQKSMDDLNRAEREIERKKFKAELASEMEQNSAKNDWANTVSMFMSQHPEYKDGSLRHSALDIAVRQIASDEANAHLSGIEIIQRAHGMVVSEFGDGQAKPNPAPETKKGAEYKPDMPPSLSKVPASSITETGEGKWAKMDNLMNSNPLAYEEALAKMSETERNEYLASA